MNTLCISNIHINQINKYQKLNELSGGGIRKVSLASVIINEPKTYNSLSFKNLNDLISQSEIGLKDLQQEFSHQSY